MRFGDIFFIAHRTGLEISRESRIAVVMLVAVLGLALGVAVLIVVLSVINGFDYALQNRVLKLIPHLTLYTNQPPQKDDLLALKLAKNPEIASFSPFVESLVLASSPSIILPATLNALPASAPIAKRFLSSQLDPDSTLPVHAFEVLLGSRLAKELKVKPGDKVTLTAPSLQVTPFGIFPRNKSFRVVGTFTTLTEQDARAAFVRESDLRLLLSGQPMAQGWKVYLKDLFVAEEVASAFLADDAIQIHSLNYWTRTHGPLYEAIRVQKVIMWLLLSLVIAVATFNVVSGMVGLVHRKRSNIAILMTLGAEKKDIVAIFRYLGLMAAFTGIGIGLLLGTGLSLVLEDLYLYFERLIGYQLMTEYFINYLPVKIFMNDLLWVGFFAFLVSILAIIISVRRAVQIQPALVLHNG